MKANIKKEEVNEDKSPNLQCSAVYLHSAIMIDGKTEATLTKVRIPTIKSMEWTPGGFLVVKAKSTHVLPGAAVKDSIILV